MPDKNAPAGGDHGGALTDGVADGGADADVLFALLARSELDFTVLALLDLVLTLYPAPRIFISDLDLDLPFPLFEEIRVGNEEEEEESE